MTVDNRTTMTVTEYARHRGVDHALISRWKASGRLVVDSDGKILARASDAVLDQDLDPTRGGKGGRPAPDAGRTTPGPMPSGPTLADATRDERMRRARLLELEIAEREGALVPVEQVRAEASRVAHQLRLELMAIADRLADPLAAEGDATRVHALLTAEFRKLAPALAEGRQADQAVAA